MRRIIFSLLVGVSIHAANVQGMEIQGTAPLQDVGHVKFIDWCGFGTHTTLVYVNGKLDIGLYPKDEYGRQIKCLAKTPILHNPFK